MSGLRPSGSLGKLRFDRSAVWIEGVPALAWGTQRDCTFAGALEAALAVTDHPCRYAAIMGVTALAFRVRWPHWARDPAWTTAAAAGQFPEEIAAFAKASGWRMQVENHREPRGQRLARLLPEITRCVGALRPVPACTPAGDMATIIGYENGGKTLLLRDYDTGGPPGGIALSVSSARPATALPAGILRLPASKLGTPLLFLRDHVKALPRRLALRNALDMAGRHWWLERGPATPEHPEFHARFWYGDTALAAWIEDHGDVTTLSLAQQQELFHVNWWNYLALRDARRAAIAFVRDSAALVEGEARRELEKAARGYEELVGVLETAFVHQHAFLGPWTGRGFSDWTIAVQRRERALLSQARKLDNQAVACLERALVALA